MRIEDRITDMTDADLRNLQANATRLARMGTPQQQADAERLIPLVGAELDGRAAARAAALRDKRTKEREAKLKAQGRS